MIKGTATGKNGRRMIVLGLSDMNLTKLREGQPIHIFGPELGIGSDVVIFWGPTEELMAAELEKLGAVRGQPARKQ